MDEAPADMPEWEDDYLGGVTLPARAFIALACRCTWTVYRCTDGHFDPLSASWARSGVWMGNNGLNFRYRK